MFNYGVYVIILSKKWKSNNQSHSLFDVIPHFDTTLDLCRKISKLKCVSVILAYKHCEVIWEIFRPVILCQNSCENSLRQEIGIFAKRTGRYFAIMKHFGIENGTQIPPYSNSMQLTRLKSMTLTNQCFVLRKDLVDVRWPYSYYGIKVQKK